MSLVAASKQEATQKTTNDAISRQDEYIQLGRQRTTNDAMAEHNQLGVRRR